MLTYAFFLVIYHLVLSNDRFCLNVIEIHIAKLRHCNHS